MACTSAADYPTLGFDPAGGDVEAVADLAETLRTAATALSEMSDVLHGAADGEWRGAAARAFRDLLDNDLRPRVDRAHQSFEDARRHIGTWRWDLSGFQSRACSLETLAAAAQSRAEAAQQQLSALPAAPSPLTPPPEDPEVRRQQADDACARAEQGRALSDARGDVERYRNEARLLREEYDEAARAVAAHLGAAAEGAPDEPGWLESMVDAFAEFMDGIFDALADLRDLVVEFLHEIAPLLQVIADIAGVLSTVLGLLSLIPGLQFLGPIALGLAVVALLATYLGTVGESGSFLEALTDPDVILGAVGVALGFGAVALGNSLTTAARVSGNTRMVPQLIGPAQEVPWGFLSICAGKVTTMEMPELALRTVSLHATWTDWIMTTAGAPGEDGTVNTVGNWFSRGLGPLTNDKPVVV